ncbi:hypothetical protein Tco_0289736 [Tanacetum coccineum]
MKELNDTNLHDMSYEHLKETALRLVPHGCFEKLYYCQTGVKLNLGLTFEDIGEAPAMTTSETTDVAEASMLEESIVDKGKGKESPADEASGTKRKRGRPPSHVDGIRIYHKNRGRSERIANMKLKKPFQFDKHGTGSTPEKAFDVDD